MGLTLRWGNDFAGGVVGESEISNRKELIKLIFGNAVPMRNRIPVEKI